MRTKIPYFRMCGARGVAVDFFAVSTKHEFDRTVAQWPDRNWDVEPPALFIVGRTGASAWYDVVPDLESGSATICAASDIPSGRICLGFGRVLRIYDVLTGVRAIDAQLQYPVQNILPLGDSATGDLIIVTELYVVRYDSQGKSLWEYWHYEPIVSSWSTQGLLQLIDFERSSVSLYLEDGRVN
jgi:hypothetical protein